MMLRNAAPTPMRFPLLARAVAAARADAARRVRPRRRRSGTAGFTLLEALIAVTLMGLILAALGAITAQWLPGWNRGFMRVQRGELFAAARRGEARTLISDPLSAGFSGRR